MKPRNLVFVSYSHDDAKYLAKLDVHLRPLLSHGVHLWWDESMRVGDNFDEVIRGKIAESLVAVVLVSPEWRASDYIQNTELPALIEAGATIAAIHLRPTTGWQSIPILSEAQWAHQDVGREGAVTITDGHESTNPEFNLAMDPLCARIAERVEADWAAAQIGTPDRRELVYDANTEAEALTVGVPGQLYDVPALPNDFVKRAADFGRLRAQLLGTDPALGLTGEVADLGLQGQGGIGKTVLAIALARDRHVRERFPDGIFWVTLGESPRVLARQQELVQAVTGDPRRTVDNPLEARLSLLDAFANRQALLIVDDVWEGADAHAFRVGGPKGRVLYTTRDERVLNAVGAEVGKVDVLETEDAWNVLAQTSRRSPASMRPDGWEQIVAATGGVILALALVGASLRDETEDAWAQVAEDLAANTAWTTHPYADVFRAMTRAVATLDEDATSLLLSLGVFPEDTDVPLATIQRYWSHLWGPDADATTDQVAAFGGRELLTFDGEVVRLHDLQRDFLRLRADDLITLHGALLDAHRGLVWDRWADLPPDEPYMWDHLIEHLMAALRHGEAEATVRDGVWVLRRLRRDTRAALEGDAAVLGVPRVADAMRRGLAGFGHLIREPEFEVDGATSLLARIPEGDDLLDASGVVELAPAGFLRPRWQPRDTDPAQVLLLDGHSGWVQGVAWSPDGTRLASAGMDRTVRVWDPTTGTHTQVLEGHTDWVRAVAWSPNGTRLASAGDDGTVRVWDPTTGTHTQVLEGHTDWVRAVAWSPDGTRLASAGDDGTVRVWDPTAEAQVLEGHTGRVLGVAWSPNGTRLASAGDDGTVRVWDPTAETQVLRGHTSAVLGVAWSPDGTRLASASDDGTVRVWDPTTGTHTQVLEGHTSAVLGVAWSPNGTRLASASRDRTVRIWDPTTGTHTQVLEGHTGRVLGVAWSPNGARLASASLDGTVRVWDPTAEAQVLEGHTTAVLGVAWSPNGTRLASASRDRTVRVWDPTTGTQTQVLEGHTEVVRAVAWSPNGTRLASTGDDGTVRVWDPTTGTQTQVLEGHTSAVLGVAWSPDGTRLASASLDRTVRVWDPSAETQVLRGHRSGVLGVAWSPDGTRLASVGDDGTVRIWDRSTTGTQTPQVLRGHTSRAVWGVAWSPDGTRLASASRDRTVRIWDRSTTGTQTEVLEGHTSAVLGVAWSPDGTRLASASDDGTVRIWSSSRQHRLSARVGQAVRNVAWADDTTLAVAYDNAFMVYDLVNPS